jgi:hypothetical protein
MKFWDAIKGAEGSVMDTFIVKRGKVDCTNVARLWGMECAKFADVVSELAQNVTLFLFGQFVKYTG